MAWRPKLYWAFVVASGAACLFYVLAGATPDPHSYLRLGVLTAVAVAVSGFKIRLPGVMGTLSMNYVAILTALLQLDTAAGIVVALAGTLTQCLLFVQVRPSWYQVIFSVAGVPMPVFAASLCLRSDILHVPDPSGWAALLVAALVYYLINTATVAGIIAYTTGKTPREVWEVSYLWTFPQYLVGGLIAGGANFLDKTLGASGIIIAGPPLYLLYRSYTTYLGRIREQQDHISEMAALHLRTIETLALAIDAKDDTTAAHLRRVQTYAAAVGEELRLSPRDMQALNAAALLHDVGKLAVPEYIISKPGKLTPEEFEKMKVHPVVGAEILQRVNFPYPVVPIVRSHHEKFDGTGYPDGLSGEDIPLGARILAAVDCLDALASDRQYRKAIPLEEAIKIVVSESGKAFDPRVVEILARRYQELDRQAKIETPEAARLASAKLSTNVKIERGLAPAAGFAQLKPVAPEPSGVKGDFSTSIASARREFQLLNEVINDLGNSLSVNDTLALLSVRLEKAVRHDALAVYLLRDEKLIPRFVRGESYRLFSSLEIPVGHGLSGWVAENHAPIVNGNPAVEPGYLNDPQKVTALRSGLAVPLSSDAGLIGVITLYSLAADAFTADDKRLMLAIAPKAATAIENSRRFERAASAAETDELTGLANARSLYSHLESAVAACTLSGNTFAVIVMDLDGFKQANDRWGHLAGNQILQSIGASLARNIREGDFVARLGGDEFVVVLAESPEHLNNYLKHVHSITSRLSDAQGEATVAISLGVASFPKDGRDSESLLACADERMYEMKRWKKRQLVA